MTAVSRILAGGRIVIPRDVREALGWPEGTEIEVISGASSVTLRAVPKMSEKPSLDASLARIHDILKYDGPVYRDADWKESIDQMLRDGEDRTG